MDFLRNMIGTIIIISTHIYDIDDSWEFKMKFRCIVIYKLILVIDGWSISCEIALKPMSLIISQHWFR